MKALFLLLGFISVLPSSLSLLRPVGHKYYVIKTKLTWPEAQTYCRRTYEDLATVESSLDWLRLNEELKREGVTAITWVGLYNDINSWRWSYNEIPLTQTYTQFIAGQPDNLGGDQSCAIVGPVGYWQDFNCGDLLPFICFNANNSYATRYVGVKSQLDWNGAKAYCRKFHTDLSFAMVAADASAIQTIAAVQSYSWIGAYRDTWKWSDGQNISNIPWRFGQPDNYFGNENCGFLQKGQFSDIKCTGLYYFICHISQPVRERQMVKLHVKSDSSIFNADVQAVILELIKKKLEENGMLENTTVTWRVKTDGQIFHKEIPDL